MTSTETTIWTSARRRAGVVHLQEGHSGATTVYPTCAECAATWTYATFYPTRLPKRCPPCTETHIAIQNTIKRRAFRLKSKYGLTIADFDSLVDSQHGTCAICREPCDDLFVDHDHETGRIRGLLCNRCNTLLGYLERGGFDLIEAAAIYLVE